MDQIRIGGLLAYASLAAKQWCPVKLASTAGYIVQATATTDVILGIVQNDPGAGEPADVCAFGECFAIAGTAATDYGTLLSANTTGVTNVNAGAGGVIGYSMQTTTTKGDKIKIFVRGNWNY